MASLTAAFGSSHSTMLLSSLEHWQALFDHVDVRAPICDFEGEERSFAEVLASRPSDAAARLSPEAVAGRYHDTARAMARLEADIARARLDALIIIGDDQKELFKDHARPAIAVYAGETIRNAAAPLPLPEDWYYRDQLKRMEDGRDAHYPCDRALARHVVQGLCDIGFDISVINALVGEQFEGHAFSFVHRRYMKERRIPIVPVFLNTYYPPNVPTPRRCVELGRALRQLIDRYPPSMRIGIMASGGLSHFLVNERFDRRVLELIRARDLDALAALPERLLRSGTSEVRNWMCVAAAIEGLALDWLSYVPGYRSQALTGVGLCFAHWQ